jgi:hypothetical protein
LPHLKIRWPATSYFSAIYSVGSFAGRIFKMVRSKLKFAIFAFLVTGAISALAYPADGQTRAFDIAQVREAFKTAAVGHFNIIDDRLAGLESEKRPGAYWLVKIKPKEAGHYAVKYVYTYNDKFYQDGENVIRFRVGGSPCDREPQSDGGISRFCSGDTVILPVRAENRYDYTFEIKYTYEDPASAAPKKPVEKAGSGIPRIENPLSSHLKFLGTKVSRMPHRSCCTTTVEYYARFEAVKPGRFNIGVSLASKNGKPQGAVGPDAFFGGGFPVLILDPGTPITYLAGYEDTINYSDEKRFSSHSGGTFGTRLMILQPGDTVEFRYMSRQEDDRASGDKLKSFDTGEKLPAVEKYPFYVNPDWSYNAFIAEFFPNDPPSKTGK